MLQRGWAGCPQRVPIQGHTEHGGYMTAAPPVDASRGGRYILRPHLSSLSFFKFVNCKTLMRVGDRRLSATRALPTRCLQRWLCFAASLAACQPWRPQLLWEQAVCGRGAGGNDARIRRYMLQELKHAWQDRSVHGMEGKFPL